MPKELVAVAPREPVLREYEDVPIQEGHVRVKIEFGAPKRGTEMTMYYGLRGAGFPHGLGNMCVGKEATSGLELDVAVETSVNYNALDDAIRSMAFEGTVAIAGWTKECTGGLDLGAVAHFNIPNLYKNVILSVKSQKEYMLIPSIYI